MKETLKEALQLMLEKSGSESVFKTNAEILKRKVIKKLIYPDINEQEFEDIKKEVLRESVFDPIQNTRSEDVFGQDEKIKTEVKDFIIKILNDWREQVETKFEVKHLTMVGSMTGFQYNKTSDVDVNVITNISDKEQLTKLRKMLPNGNPLPGTSHPVNFWIGGTEDVLTPARFENIYNIVIDEWEKKSDKKDIKIPYPYIMEVSKFFMDGFDLAMSECDRDILEVETYMSYDPTKQQLSEKEKREFIAGKVAELRTDVDRLKIGKHILRSFMVEGYNDMPFKVSINYEHEDPRYSMNSMVYKMIDRLGYTDKISTQVSKALNTIKSAEKYLATEAIQEQNRPQVLIESVEVKPLRKIKIKRVV
jgi:hypothetical protein